MWNQYFSPESLDEALQLNHLYREQARLLAGGTDLVLNLSSQRYAAVEAVIDISRVPELSKIDVQDDSITIGAAVTLSQIVRSELLNSAAPVLVTAARQIAGPQIRNLATIGGNVVNASPAADMIPALLVLDSLVWIRSWNGQARQIPLEAFLLGNRKVDLAIGEIVTGFQFPAPDSATRHHFRKVQPRRAMAIAMLNLAILMTVSDQKIMQVRIAMGAVAPTAVRVKSIEKVLTDLPFHLAENLDLYTGISQDILPISDFRASREYRLRVAQNLLREAIVEMIGSTKTVDHG